MAGLDIFVCGGEAIPGCQATRTGISPMTYLEHLGYRAGRAYDADELIDP